MTQSSNNSLLGRPEIKLLLCCGTTYISKEKSEQIRSLMQTDLDWAYLLETAGRHGLISLLYRNLGKTGGHSVPTSVMDRLRNHFYLNARHNALLTEELNRLLCLFEEHGIVAIPFKGPALAEELYGDISCREIFDLDVLVKREDVLRGMDLMASLGYTSQSRFTKGQMEAYLAAHNEISFANEEKKVIVELQWEIAPRYFGFPIAPLRLWDHNQVRSKSGYLYPPPEEMLLMLCVHGAKDLWEQLKWICDVAELLRVHKDLDWEKTTELAYDSGGRRMLFLGLLLAKDLFDASIPEKIVKEIEADSKVRRLATKVEEGLFRKSNGGFSILRSFFFYLKAKERLRDQIQYCVGLAMTTTPGDWALLKLPRSLFLLYFLIRPIRLIKKYGGGIARRISSKKNGTGTFWI